VLLTDDGRVQAKRLVRAHRLWETYLDRTGTPKELIHDKAHRLEHLSDEKTVEYLDDKLGHPVTDPHGSVIPNESELVYGKNLMLSLLRSGNRAVIVEFAKDASLPQLSLPQLSLGQEIEIGPRANQGQSWTVITEDGSILNLNHQQADAVIVQLVKPKSLPPSQNN
jgi:manganese/iron transport system permease protein/iron/zinc/copper transport system permease protein